MQPARQAAVLRESEYKHIDVQRLRRIPDLADPHAFRGYARRGDELFKTGVYVGEIEHVIPAPNRAGLRLVVRRP